MPTDRRGWTREEHELDRELRRNMWRGVLGLLFFGLLGIGVLLGLAELARTIF